MPRRRCRVPPRPAAALVAVAGEALRHCLRELALDAMRDQLAVPAPRLDPGRRVAFHAALHAAEDRSTRLEAVADAVLWHQAPAIAAVVMAEARQAEYPVPLAYVLRGPGPRYTLRDLLPEVAAVRPVAVAGRAYSGRHVLNARKA